MSTSEIQKNEYRKVKIKISKAYHYKATKGVESDQEVEKEVSPAATPVPEVTALTPRIITPPSTVIVIDSPPPEVPNKPFYEAEVKTQTIISRYTPPTSSILENILLRNRIDTNNNDNNQRQPNATPPPSSPTEMAYSYKKSHRYVHKSQFLHQINIFFAFLGTVLFLAAQTRAQTFLCNKTCYHRVQR